MVQYIQRARVRSQHSIPSLCHQRTPPPSVSAFGARRHGVMGRLATRRGRKSRASRRRGKRCTLRRERTTRLSSAIRDAYLPHPARVHLTFRGLVPPQAHPRPGLRSRNLPRFQIVLLSLSLTRGFPSARSRPIVASRPRRRPSAAPARTTPCSTSSTFSTRFSAFGVRLRRSARGLLLPQPRGALPLLQHAHLLRAGRSCPGPESAGPPGWASGRGTQHAKAPTRYHPFISSHCHAFATTSWGVRFSMKPMVARA